MSFVILSDTLYNVIGCRLIFLYTLKETLFYNLLLIDETGIATILAPL